jgi:hypothetical protein
MKELVFALSHITLQYQHTPQIMNYICLYAVHLIHLIDEILNDA